MGAWAAGARPAHAQGLPHRPALHRVGYATDLEANFRYVAKFVDKILKGAKPADLHVEQPTKFQLVLNLKTAQALGLKIPQTVLLRVDELIE